MLRFFSFLSVILLLVAPLALAQTTILKISAGTGFVISRNGNIITNAHVVRGCESINVHTPQGDLPATLRASDAEHDLAVLEVKGLSGAPTAPLRWNIGALKVGDPVVVMGFPGKEGVNGHYSFKTTTVTSLMGPTGEPRWIQLASVAEHGNSGGPVLDMTGNVIGVISGMAQTYRVGRDGKPEDKPLTQTDVAITLPTLQDFLHRNAISFYESPSGLVGYAYNALEANAVKFIVPVRCIQSRTVMQ